MLQPGKNGCLSLVCWDHDPVSRPLQTCKGHGEARRFPLEDEEESCCHLQCWLDSLARSGLGPEWLSIAHVYVCDVYVCICICMSMFVYVCAHVSVSICGICVDVYKFGEHEGWVGNKHCQT